jgi:cysteinyl-tRNA synthetase
MSKSLKNFISIEEYLSSSWTNKPADDLRVYFLQHKYHSTLHFSKDRILEAAVFRRKMESYFTYVNDARQLPGKRPCRESDFSHKLRNQLFDCKRTVKAALIDDFDTPTVMRVLSDLVGFALQGAVGASVDVSESIHALIATEQYVKQILSLFGLNLISSRDTVRSPIGEGVNLHRVIDSFVKYRAEVRKLALLAKSHLKNGDQSFSNELLSSCIDGLLKQSDFVREDLKFLGISVSDKSPSRLADLKTTALQDSSSASSQCQSSNSYSWAFTEPKKLS